MKQKAPFENIEPMPNPKNLTVQKVFVSVETGDGKTFAEGPGYIRNANIYPARVHRIAPRW